MEFGIPWAALTVAMSVPMLIAFESTHENKKIIESKMDRAINSLFDN